MSIIKRREGMKMDSEFMKAMITNEETYEDVKMVSEMIQKAMSSIRSLTDFNNAVKAVHDAIDIKWYDSVLTDEEHTELKKMFKMRPIFNKGIFHTTNYLTIMQFEQELTDSPVVGSDVVTVTPSIRLVNTRSMCEAFLKATTLKEVIKHKYNSAVFNYNHYLPKIGKAKALEQAKHLLQDLLEHPELTQELKIAIVRKFEGEI